MLTRNKNIRREEKTMSKELDFLSQHGAQALKDAASLGNRNGGGNFANDNIWFDWGKKEEHTIRIVGDFIITRSHWIGESKYSSVTLLDAAAFKGENKLPMSVACGNWDSSTESVDPDGDACPICVLGAKADKMLQLHGKELQDADKEVLKAIRKQCTPKCQYLFKVIDRDNPYLDEDKTRKGYKILRAPEKLLEAITQLSKSMKGIGISSPDEGIDIVIKKVVSDKKKSDVTYTALAVMDGMTVRQTPLTEEERNYHDIDLHKFAGKPIDKERFEEFLTDDNNIRTIYESDIDESGNEAPF